MSSFSSSVNELPYIGGYFEGDRVTGLCVSDRHRHDDGIEYTIGIDTRLNEGSDEECECTDMVSVLVSYDEYESDTRRERILRSYGVITETEGEEAGYDLD